MEPIKLTVMSKEDEQVDESPFILLFNQVTSLCSTNVIICLITLFTFLILLIASKIYVKLTCGMCKCSRRLDGKVVLITGATSGIGKETASDLYNRGATVILAVRSIQRGLDAVNQIKEKSKSHPSSYTYSNGSMKKFIFGLKSDSTKMHNLCKSDLYSFDQTNERSPRTSGQLIVKHCDLASLSSVRAFVTDLLKCFKSIDIIILNAGMVPPLGRHLSLDGYEMQFQCNHLSHFLMINLLLPRLISNCKSEKSIEKVSSSTAVGGENNLQRENNINITNSNEIRIICVSSMLHKCGTIDFDNLNFEKKILDPFWQYSMTKLANILMVKELSRKLEKLNVPITVNSLHPGLVKTSINRNTPWYLKHFIQPIMYKLWAKNTYEGAQTTIYLAVSPEVNNVTGEYFIDCKKVTSSDTSNDVDLAKKLWLVSENLVGLKKKCNTTNQINICQDDNYDDEFETLVEL